MGKLQMRWSDQGSPFETTLDPTTGGRHHSLCVTGTQRWSFLLIGSPFQHELTRKSLVVTQSNFIVFMTYSSLVDISEWLQSSVDPKVLTGRICVRPRRNERILDGKVNSSLDHPLFLVLLENLIWFGLKTGTETGRERLPETLFHVICDGRVPSLNIISPQEKIHWF